MSDWIQTKRQTHQPTDTQKGGGGQRERGGGEGRVLREGGRVKERGVSPKTKQTKDRMPKLRAMGVQLNSEHPPF